jgi:hypothetical protein
MKALFHAVQRLVRLQGEAPITRSNPTGSFLNTLPQPLQDALVAFELRNRGHRHQLADEALSPGDMLTHPLPGSPEYARRRMVCDTSRQLLEALVSEEDLPPSQHWTALLGARDELGWLAYHAELLLQRHCSGFRNGLAAHLQFEESRIYRAEGKCLMELVIRHRRAKLSVKRVIPLHRYDCATLKSADIFVQRNRDLVRQTLEGAADWPEFQACEPATVSPLVALLPERARAELQRALNPFTYEERHQIIENWASLRPTLTSD